MTTLLSKAVADVMFASNGQGRLLGDSPDMYLLRTREGAVCRFHADLPDGIVAMLRELVERPRGRPGSWAREYAGYANVLSAVGPFEAVRAGPFYDFPERIEQDGEAISIDGRNAHLLRGGLDEWLPDVAAGLPMAAVVANGRAVALCASVRASAAVHCAGVETVPEHRGRGLAGRAVSAWAATVRSRGAAPIYGTTFDNLSSQRVAARLGLRPVGTEFWIKCGR